MSQPVNELASLYASHGLRVVPIKLDGSKSPDLRSYSEYYQPETSYNQFTVDRWFPQNTPRGIGILLGKSGGHLICFDIEYIDFAEEWLCLQHEFFPELDHKFPIIKTPGKDSSGGRHFYFRYPDQPAKQDLAFVTAEESVARTGVASHKLAIEVRGHGGLNLIPGGDSRQHSSGRPYEHSNSIPIWDAPLLTQEQFEGLCEIARSLSKEEVQAALVTYEKERPPVKTEPNGGVRPGDDFNERADWQELLQEHFTFIHQRPDGSYLLRRVGKETGISATLGKIKSQKGVDLLYSFTPNATPFKARKTYDKIGAYAELYFGGDIKECAKHLAKHGYGTPATKKESKSVSIIVSSDDDEKIDPDDMPEGLEFPIEVFPETLAYYCYTVAESIGCPVDLPSVAILPFSSVAIGNTRKVKWKDKHEAFCPMYMALVAIPGSGKTPVLDLIRPPLSIKEDEFNNKYVKELLEYEQDMEQYESDKKSRGKKGDIEQSLLAPNKPIRKRVSIADTTCESIAPILTNNPRGLIVIKDEVATWINDMNKYRDGKGSDHQFWMESWSSQTIIIDRKSQQGVPIYVDSPFISLYGGIQPGKLHLLINPNKDDDGFSDRILLSYPKGQGLLPYNFEKVVDDQTQQIWEYFFNKLYEMEGETSIRADGTECKKPSMVSLPVHLRPLFLEWDAANKREISEAPEGSRYVGHYRKMDTYLMRFSLILHCLRQVSPDEADWPENANELDEQSVQGAIALVEYFKSHARKAYWMPATRNEARYKDVYDYIKRKGGKCKRRELQRCMQHISKSSKDWMKIFEEMEHLGWGKSSPDGRVFSIFGGEQE